MKLYYFDMPGRGECMRLLLHHAKVVFEDVRIKITDWPQMKDTFEGKQLPVLEVNGKRMAQSYAILEYLGIKYGYMPTAPMEAYETLAIMNVLEDMNGKMFNAFSPFSPYDEETKKKLQPDVPRVDMPIFLPYIEAKLEAKECKDYLVGCRYTIADFYLLGFYIQLKLLPAPFKLWEEFPGIPLLKALIRKRVKDFAHLYPQPCTKPKLYYFDAPARGEMIRLILRHAKVDFEDIRVKYSEWPALKEKMSLKQMPVYECCGEQMPQTDAIMQHLSIKYGYLPLDPEKMYRVLFLAGTVKDFFEGFVRFFYGGFPEEKKKKLEEEYYAKSVPLYFQLIESRLKENDSADFLVGKQYTMADFYILGAARWLILNPQTEAKFAKQLADVPLLQAYLKKRIVDFP